MAPKPAVVSTAIQTYTLVRFDHNNVGTSAAVRMSSPPIVGVPAFGLCVVGPSARITCPIWNSRSFRTIHGPSARLIASAERLAAAVRDVMYCGTFNTDSWVRNG